MAKHFPDNSNITRLMINDIAKTNVISVEDERKLFELYHSSKDPLLKDTIKTKIISSNLRFVLKVAIYYNKITNTDLNDLMTEGKIGLYNAFAKFDHTKNIKFISLAVWDIRCMISKYLEENDLVRIPAHLKLKVNKAKKSLNTGKPSDIDFDMELLIEQNSSPMSLDTKLGDGDDDMTLSDVLEDTRIINQEKKYYTNLMQNELKQTLESILNEEELTVIKCMYGFNQHVYNINETEQMIDKSRERVRQIRDRALAKLKKHTNIKQLHELIQNTY